MYIYMYIYIYIYTYISIYVCPCMLQGSRAMGYIHMILYQCPINRDITKIGTNTWLHNKVSI